MSHSDTAYNTNESLNNERKNVLLALVLKRIQSDNISQYKALRDWKDCTFSQQ